MSWGHKAYCSFAAGTEAVEVYFNNIGPFIFRRVISAHLRTLVLQDRVQHLSQPAPFNECRITTTWRSDYQGRFYDDCSLGRGSVLPGNRRFGGTSCRHLRDTISLEIRTTLHDVISQNKIMTFNVTLAGGIREVTERNALQSNQEKIGRYCMHCLTEGRYWRHCINA